MLPKEKLLKYKDHNTINHKNIQLKNNQIDKKNKNLIMGKIYFIIKEKIILIKCPILLKLRRIKILIEFIVLAKISFIK